MKEWPTGMFMRHDLEGADNGDVLEVVADRELLEVTAGEVLYHV